MKRTHHCGELRDAHAGQEVSLAGWVAVVRDHGGLTFVDLRDREGITQIVFNPDYNQPAAKLARTLGMEFVIAVRGRVQCRPEGTRNSKLPTGDVEVVAHALEILNPSDTPPFPLDEDAEDVSEDLRLTHRYLDLRRTPMQRNLRLRHRATKIVRGYFDEHGFVEIETPILFKSTPEGAREYLVPSRVNPAKFYALAQSPQQYKQLLVIAGFEKYFQMARCFRDEDLRADRQPEFTQIDLEMSFVEREDVYALIEGMFSRLWSGILDVKLPLPFPRISFQDAMNRFGTDKPDTRFALELVDLTEEFRESSFRVFSTAIQAGGVVKAINVKKLADVTQGQMDQMTELAKTFGAKGLAWIKVEGPPSAPETSWKSPIAKFLRDTEKKAVEEKLSVEEGDLILFVADQWRTACEVLGRLRSFAAALLIEQGKLKISSSWNFLWVEDFPLITFDSEQGRFVSSHHPFTAPVAEDVSLLDSDPTRVRGQHYDIVLNGVELGGGSIRIHRADLQRKVFEDVLKIPRETAEARFGHLLKALGFGAPPHGGIALGFDRMVAMLCGTTSIRDVIAFPKTAKAVELMTGAPSEVDERQLRELRIRLVEQGESKKTDSGSSRQGGRGGEPL